jgi:hypothetical protein
MRHINSLGDRLLGLFVPRAVAGACCESTGRCFTTSSGCSPGWARRCCFDCNCASSCGSCFQ